MFLCARADVSHVVTVTHKQARGRVRTYPSLCAKQYTNLTLPCGKARPRPPRALNPRMASLPRRGGGLAVRTSILGAGDPSGERLGIASDGLGGQPAGPLPGLGSAAIGAGAAPLHAGPAPRVERRRIRHGWSTCTMHANANTSSGWLPTTNQHTLHSRCGGTRPISVSPGRTRGERHVAHSKPISDHATHKNHSSTFSARVLEARTLFLLWSFWLDSTCTTFA